MNQKIQSIQFRKCGNWMKRNSIAMKWVDWESGMKRLSEI